MPGTKGDRWSREVTEHSDALDLEQDVFTRDSPRAIAESLKRSAEQSRRRKSDPYRSAMSMLTFYINRAGKNLPKPRRDKLEAAKDELRRLYGRTTRRPRAAGPRDDTIRRIETRSRSKVGEPASRERRTIR